MICQLIWDVDGALFDMYSSIVEVFHRALQAEGVAVDVAHIKRLTEVASYRSLLHTIRQRNGNAR
ncbi:MAG: hypothetical protein JXB35_09180 [Anaerolineae bacterium]|nr:hypothetical protein [Anaerolineae bacterium]